MSPEKITGTDDADEGCVLHDLAHVIHRNEGVEAVWVDSARKRVSYASTDPSMDAAAKRQIEEVVARYRPASTPTCGVDSWQVDCELCKRGLSQPMPPGVRLVAMPGAGVLVERHTDAPRSSWRWIPLPWPHFAPRQYAPPARNEEEWRGELRAASLCGIAVLTGMLLEHATGAPRAAVVSAYFLAYLFGGWHSAIDAARLLRVRILDVHFLMLAVAIGAASIGQWGEGAMLLLLFSFSGSLEAMAMARTEREINSLMKGAPREALVLDANGVERSVPVEAVLVGMRLVIRPGDQFPVDAEVVDGETAADESSLSGESVPVDKRPGDRVLGGTLNGWGRVTCRALAPAAGSALARIIHLIRSAQESKAPSQRFTDRFGSGYTYVILGSSLLLFLGWWQIGGLLPFASADGRPSALYRAMTFLVVASPCALVLSIPATILAGIAAGASRGILFRGGAAIESLADINRLALDKTGTLTSGELRVRAVETLPPGREEELLDVAAALGRHSTHPVSRALAIAGAAQRGAAERGASEQSVEGFRARTGLGLEGKVNGNAEIVRLGRRSLFPDEAWVRDLADPPAGVTEVLVARGDLRGRVLFEDTVREESRPLLSAMKREGIAVSMLTGDRAESARLVADRVGLEDVHSGLRPEEKVERIRAWTAEGEKVAMVGDGVNDAPCLAAAHVAIAMGARGSDAAIEQADVILMRDRLENVTEAIRLSRRARTIIRQNLALSLGVILLLSLSAVVGIIPLTVGVLGHEGSTVLVVLNSLRLLGGRTH